MRRETKEMIAFTLFMAAFMVVTMLTVNSVYPAY